MPEVIHFVRHAQGYHNVAIANHAMHDPALTPLGEKQCRDLRSSFPYMDSVDLVVASPLRRTLNTALLSFQPHIEKKGLTVIALPDVQETADLPCDTGSEPDILVRDFAGQPVDFGLVEPGWNIKGYGKYGFTTKQLTARALRARKWLYARPEKEIIVVTHGGFLHHLTQDWSDRTRFRDTGWANTEFRSFRFKEAPGDDFPLVETQVSKYLRAGTEQPLTTQERVELKLTEKKDAEVKEVREEQMVAKSAL
ncbi:MAG: hypothetical protein M1837_005112 [Sclerophora amabilis]|nr:MAG: hypothetical protein M1837_005112 [Sclerophora amabilis]